MRKKIGFSCCTFVCDSRYAVAPFSTFKKLGIPGPPPWPFVGNLPEISKKPGQPFLVEKELAEKYGRVFGYYLGRIPAYMISDVDLLKQILVKEFSKFPNRPLANFGGQGMSSRKGLLQLEDEDWRRIRTTITPTFSAVKLKQIAPLIHQSCDTLCKKLEKIAQSGEKVDMWRTYGKFTMEVILASAFGVQVGIQTSDDELYTSNAEKLFQQPGFSFVLMVFPFMRPVLQLVTSLFFHSSATEAAASAAFIMKAAEEVLHLRRESGVSQRKDLLELMLRAEVTDKDGKHVSKLSDDEVLAQSFTFILAGYETTSNALAYTTYCLALNPEVQEKLIEEIDEAVGDKETADYETVQNLEYLDMVLCEALRLYPPAFRFGRICSESCTLNGVHFLKDTMAIVPVYHLHRDPEYWPDPETFDPERFSPEAKQKRSPYCYLPFGTGPRSCIGMRFALIEAKLALVHLLKRFTFQRSAETEVPLQLKAAVTMAPKNGIQVKIISRK
ncbi:cytochrome P450 3A41-like [Orbicella faveolata]|uniref:cytochrome P450 3A41-like n=2 Tax=Orbicella faveolata TaxID=48498 RepID=UPI0009E238E5|nr:cytochrome P450 3A41-like [Orbicella faveolata]